MNRLKFLLIVILLLASDITIAAVVRGVVTSASGEPLPFASVYIKNTTHGVSTNLKGEYFLETNPGTYTLVFRIIGYEAKEEIVVLTAGKTHWLNVVLSPKANMIKEVEVFSDPRDRAKEIMDSVRAHRKDYLNAVQSYSCKTYLKTSLEKEPVKGVDSLSTDTVPQKDLKEHLRKEKTNMIESIVEVSFEEPDRYKEVVLAHHDYAEVKGSGGRSVSMSMGFSESDIIPETPFEDNPYILVSGINGAEFNFYKNLIDFPSACQKPLLSPIAAGSSLAYTYDYNGSFTEKGRTIYKLQVIPRNKSEALFYGEIFIEDSTWALVAVDLSINRDALFFCKDFSIIQNYELMDTNCYLPVRREISYTIRDGRYHMLGNTRVDHSDYKVNVIFPTKHFGNEIKSFSVDAFNKDSVFWMQERPIQLKESELQYIKKTDSLKAYYTSDEYYAKQDSAFNRIDEWSWLAGIGHRNRKRGTEWYISGLPEQVNPVGIGGYRHRLPGHFNLEFKDATLLETQGFIDYGFRNKDVKGKLGIGYTYIPKKFVRTFVTIGSYYEMINQYASFEQIFSRSNYVHTKTFSVAQRMEITNGFFGEITFLFSDQRPINNLQLEQWSDWLFGSLNTPGVFDPYLKAEIKAEFKYRVGQEYIIKGNKKYIIGTDWPELQLIYRRGIPGFLGSEVNYEYIEIGAKDEAQLARFGSSSWQIYAGTFTNRTSLRVLEHKYFRGSDRYWFSDPVRSFQLLGPTLNTRSEYFRANYIHHFEGTLLGKIPLLKKMKMDFAGGAGFLMINDQDFAHFEMFGGLEKIFRIRKQLFRIGVYAVTADNSVKNADYTFKVGLGFYNTFTKKWEY